MLACYNFLLALNTVQSATGADGNGISLNQNIGLIKILTRRNVKKSPKLLHFILRVTRMALSNVIATHPSKASSSDNHACRTKFHASPFKKLFFLQYLVERCLLLAQRE